MADADRAGMRHDGDHAALETPCVGRAAFEDLLDPLQLDEVIAATDRADLSIA
jgi:hypothetical protein